MGKSIHKTGKATWMQADVRIKSNLGEIEHNWKNTQFWTFRGSLSCTGLSLSVLIGNSVTHLCRKTHLTLSDGAWSLGALHIMTDVGEEIGSSMWIERSCFAHSLNQSFPTAQGGKQWGRWPSFPNREEKSDFATHLILPASLFPIVNWFCWIHH